MRLLISSNLLRLFSLVLCACVLSACSSSTQFRKSDCDQTPTHYGTCAADLGIRKETFTKLAQYCANEAKTFDLNAFESSRVQREKEICSKPSGVFKLQFKASANLNGPVTCPRELLVSDGLRRADEDAKAAAHAYLQKDVNEAALAKSQERRFNADRNGYDVGLSDRTFLMDNREESATRDSYRNQFRKILASYPDLREEEITEDLRCNSEGEL
jgi:hypothetical protein